MFINSLFVGFRIGALGTTAALLVAGATGAATRQPEGPPRADPELPWIECVAATDAPRIDGRLDDPCWKDAPASRPLVDEYGLAVRLKTTFQVCHKEGVVYLAIRARYDAEKPPEKPPGNSTVRDGSLWQGEAIEVFLDPDNADTPGYYQLAITPQGTSGDWFCPQRRDPEAQWEPDYEVRGHWTPQEWTVEYALPLGAFDRTAKVYENFGLNVTRVDSVYGDAATWSPLRGEGYHVPHRFGELRGMKASGVVSNEPGLFRPPPVRINDRVIRAEPAVSLVPAEAPAFVRGPAVKTARGGAEIAFELNTETDVAIWIEDTNGERVRHLAAGMLGEDPPAPLEKGRLAQTLRWDLKDDWGKRVAPGSYRVCVGARAQAKLDRVIGYKPQPKDIQGVCVDRQGRLYVLGGKLDQWTELMQFDRRGEYRRTILPPPAGVPPEKLKGLNVIDLGAGGQVRFGSTRLGSVLPHLDLPMPQSVLVNSRGQIIIFGGEHPSGAFRFYKINPDGSLPEDWLGPYVKDVHWVDFFDGWAKRFHFALDPEDEELIYLSGLKETHRRDWHEGDELKNRVRYYNAVCKLHWKRGGPLVAHVGKINYRGPGGGNKPGELFDPQGICFDAAGNLYVCDRGNDRIQVFDKVGKYLRQWKHPRPYQVAAGRKSGAVYVMGTEQDGVYITKYAAGNKPAVVARSANLGKESYWRTMALDESGPQAQLWVVREQVRSYQIDRIVDRGTEFSPPELVIGQEPPRDYYRLGVGWDSDVVWSSGWWFDGKTGREIGPSRGHGDEVLAARDGTWVTRSGFFRHYISIYPEDWPTNPQAQTLARWETTPAALARAGRRGFTVAPNGDVYVARYYQFQRQSSAREAEEGPWMHVAIDGFSPDGRKIKPRVVYELSHAAHAPAVDIRGNIYVIDNLGRRIGELYEEDVAANLPSWVPQYGIDWDKLRRGEPVAVGAEKWALDPLIQGVGTLYKFGPRGGGLLWRAAQKGWRRFDPDTEKGLHLDWGFFPPGEIPDRPATHWSAQWVGADKLCGVYPRWQEGVEWEFLGVSLASGRYNLSHSGCTCSNCRISVDDFGRTYVPAAHRSCVRLIDTAGNEILRIGRYGNADSTGPGTALPEAGIPMRYPIATALSKQFLYVAEWRYGRIFKIALGYQRQQEVPVVIE